MSRSRPARRAVTINRALFTSDSGDWGTDRTLYLALDHEFRFTLDPCPNGANDGLERSWVGERVYCNPPYGRELVHWLMKAPEADLAVYLLPARTDTAWFHEWALKADEIRFIRGRLKFRGAPHNAPFPSILVIFRRKP